MRLLHELYCQLLVKGSHPRRSRAVKCEEVTNCDNRTIIFRFAASWLLRFALVCLRTVVALPQLAEDILPSVSATCHAHVLTRQLRLAAGLACKMLMGQ